MSRGRKGAKPVEDQIKEKEEQILRLQNEICALKKQKEEQDLKSIKEAIAASGKSIAEVLAALK